MAFGNGNDIQNNTNKQLLDIFILSVRKTQTGKTILKFAYIDPKETEYKKGLIDIESWFDDLEFFNKIQRDMILKTDDKGNKIIKSYKAEYEYVPSGYNGQARLTIKNIYL